MYAQVQQIKQRLVQAHMKVAEVYAGLSRAKRGQVGAIVVKNETVIAIGYNGTPPGWDNVCEKVEEDGSLTTLPWVIHAEQNALDKLTRGGQGAYGGSLYVTKAPCLECAKRILGAGISEVFYKEVYRSGDGLEYLKKGNVRTTQVLDERATLHFYCGSGRRVWPSENSRDMSNEEFFRQEKLFYVYLRNLGYELQPIPEVVNELRLPADHDSNRF